MIGERFKLKKDRNRIITVSIVLAVLLFYINIEVHRNYLYNRQFEEHKDRVQIESLDLSYRIGNPEILSAIKNMAKRSSVMNDIVKYELPLDDPSVLSRLMGVKEDYNASIIYIMDREGNVVSCTPYDGGKSLTGKNYSFRPYFTNAITGETTIYPAVGVTTGKRGLYYSTPIFDVEKGAEDSVIGVMVAKMDLSIIDNFVESYTTPVAIVSSTGIIFASNIPEWMFNFAFGGELSELEEFMTKPQFMAMFPEGPPEILPFSVKSNKAHFDGVGYSILSTPVSLEDESGQWEFVYFHGLHRWYTFIQPWLINLLITILFAFLITYIAMYFKKLLMELDQKDIIRENEERLKIIFENVQAGILIIDPLDHTIFNANKIAADMFGFKIEDIEGEKCQKFLCKKLDGQCPITDTEQIIDTSERIMINSKGENVTVLKSATIINLSGKEYILESFIDITERKMATVLLEESKIAAESANRAKSEFLANMSHEIRTPMNAILGFTRLLYDQEEDKEKQRKLQIVKTSGENLLTLINDILDFSKIESGKLKISKAEFNLRAMLDHIYSMFKAQANEKNLVFEINAEESLPEMVFGDRHRIQQILINIIGNAFKFTESGGIRVNCRYLQPSSLAEIVIRDTGIGIEQTKLKSVFSAFSQADSTTERKFGGTGLGLTISKKLAEAMNGNITVKSDPGKGSVFRIGLLLPEVQVVDGQEEESKLDKTTGSFTDYVNGMDRSVKKDFRILLAEDNKINRLLTEALLADMGLSCESAENGLEAIGKLKEINYDLLLLDMQMPVMDGLQSIRIIRADESLKDIHVIALTANAMAGDADKFLSAGCDDYISKPIDRELFNLKISTLMAGWNET